MKSVTDHLRAAKDAFASGDISAAEIFLKNAVRADPRCITAHHLLAKLAKDTGRMEAAVDCYAEAVKVDVCPADVFLEYGELLQRLGQYGKAESLYRGALEKMPDAFLILINFGTLLNLTGKNGEAETVCRQALDIDPESFVAMTLYADIMRNRGKTKTAVEWYRKALEKKPGFMVAFSNMLLSLNYSDHDPDSVFRDHQNWAEVMSAGVQKTPGPPAVMPGPGARIKVGYVCANFKTHSVSYYTEAFLKHHDRGRFEIYCYSDVVKADPVTMKFKSFEVQWRDISALDDVQVFETVRTDGIHILVDLDGHAGNRRLPVFLKKAAPIQVTYCGYPNTTGISEMDYRLTDEWADPAGEEKYYSEELVRLPHGFLCYTPPSYAPDVSPPPCRKNGFVTFGSFNNLSKITRDVVLVWASILKRAPDSVLVLKNRSFQDERMRDRYIKLFKEQGVEFGRIMCRPPSATQEEHLRMYGCIDIGLDTFPYNGTATTCEALWMGVPVIAFRGDRHRSCVTYSLYSQLKLPEFCAEDPKGYVEAAVSLAHDREKLADVRNTLREKITASSLCDGASFTRDLEAAYLGMLNSEKRKTNSEQLL